MNKYTTLLKLNWQNGLVYRTSLFLWRLRQFLGTLMALTVWTVIFDSNSQAFNYTANTMITYIFLVALLQSLIVSSALNGLAGRVHAGEISNQLIKPVNLFGYLVTEEIADKLKNVLSILVETIILFLIFKPIIIFPSLGIFLLFISWALFGVIINFFITLMFGSLGFWSPETWGPRFLFFMVLDFTAGKLFPLDILPLALQKILYLTPFPYLSFVQIQLFLGRFNNQEIFSHFIVMLFWIGILGSLTNFLWKKGLRSYEAVGR